VVKLHNYYSSKELEQAIGSFMAYYNNKHYHEALDNLTPADVCFGREKEVWTRRELIKIRTLRQSRRQHGRRLVEYNATENRLEKSLLMKPLICFKCFDGTQQFSEVSTYG